ncbi:hypothetical protein FOZ60_016122 [Perkinsus olseni]|uniref:Uncharacterized protein n=1 Tax=Perkinsus olseni TaxID=32597 RepID=A0A7J6P4Q6_PEROL|nr:hypothetical protein FOZ60_016122 [Perkinsus olseni]
MEATTSSAAAAPSEPLRVADEDVDILTNELGRAGNNTGGILIEKRFKDDSSATTGWMDSPAFLHFTAAVVDCSAGYLGELSSWASEELTAVFKALAALDIDQPFTLLAACLPERLMDLTPKNLSEYLSLLARTPEVVSDDLLSLILDELHLRKWQGGFAHQDLNSALSSLLALCRAARDNSPKIFAQAADVVAQMPGSSGYFSRALDSLTTITAAPGQGMPDGRSTVTIVGSGFASGATALLDRLTKEGVDPSTTPVLLGRRSAAAADNLAESIAEEVLRRDILLFTPNEVSELLAAFGGGYGLAKAFCRDYIPDRMSTFEVNDMVAMLYAVGTQNLDLLESMCQYMSTYNYAKMRRELRPDVLCRSLHDLSLSAEATTKAKKLFEFAANDFDLAKCDSASLCELAKAMLRCKEASVDKKKVFSRLCSTRTAVDDPDVLVAIAMSGVWDSGYFEEASQRQLKSKSKSAERSIYTLYAISYGLNFHIDSGWADDTTSPPDSEMWPSMEAWTTTFCRLRPFDLADQLAQPCRLNQFNTLDVEALSSLLWALAATRVWNEKLILYACAHLVHRVESNNSSSISSSEAMSKCLVRAIWALAVLNAPLMKFGKAVVTLTRELEKMVDTLSPSDLVNLITALSVFVPTTLLKQHGGAELLSKACGKLVEALTGQLEKSYRPDWMATAAKALYFARVVARVPSSSGLNDTSLSAVLSARKCAPLGRLSMKAATQLGVVCHGVKADGVRVNAMALGLFPCDVLYDESKEVLEIERPNQFVRTDEGTITSICGWDQLSRECLSALGFRLTAISQAEWAALMLPPTAMASAADQLSAQIKYVKSRMRSSARPKVSEIPMLLRGRSRTRSGSSSSGASSRSSSASSSSGSSSGSSDD